MLHKKIAVLGVLILGLAYAGSAQAQVQMECKKGGGRALSAAVVVYFDTGSVAIKDKGKKALNEFADQVKGNPSIEICLVGQADKQGDAKMNEALAKRRAEAVKSYLQGHGLKNERYQVVVRGEAGGESWLGKMLGGTKFESDRRVEVTAIEN